MSERRKNKNEPATKSLKNLKIFFSDPYSYFQRDLCEQFVRQGPRSYRSIAFSAKFLHSFSYTIGVIVPQRFEITSRP